ncbi:MAG: carbohydrate-binding family 9-like protein [Cellulosilyticaceae bacterium]
MTYCIKMKQCKVDWEEITPVAITHYPWGQTYMPHTKAWLYRVEGEGFYLKMRCEESEPKAVYTEANEPVYKDSCMEFFANYYPDEEGTGYINFEMNSKGVVLCEYGHPGERVFLKDRGFEVPVPKVTKGDIFWEIELFIPDTFIQAVYDKATISTSLRGNFYKCGDETHTPHYGSWAPIDNPTPAFHKPEFFEKMIIEG